MVAQASYHLDKDKDTWKFECDRCGHKFPAKQRLKAHIMTHLPKKLQSFECNMCGKTFDKVGFLRKHVERHEKPVTPLQCPTVPEFSKRSTIIFNT
jgi:hypothetical protein